MHRRQFLGHAAALTALLPASPLASLAAQAASGRPLIPREVFFGDADVSWMRLSPDGAHIAYIAPVDGVRNLWVAPLADLKAARPVTRATDRPIGSFFRWAFTNRHVVYFQERDGDENWRASSVDIGTGAIVPLTPARGVRAYVQESSHRFPQEMLFGHNARDKRFFDLHRIDVVTGRGEPMFENDQFSWLFTDNALRLRLAGRYLKDGSVEWLERGRSGTWVPFLTVPIGDGDGTRLWDFSDDGKTLY
ncbi:MAG: S9 family peptidase, partial [Proteobacteria bacterium]|nr:S9 family peptidase [Pseudomonadota bacterium]